VNNFLPHLEQTEQLACSNPILQMPAVCAGCKRAACALTECPQGFLSDVLHLFNTVTEQINTYLKALGEEVSAGTGISRRTVAQVLATECAPFETPGAEQRPQAWSASVGGTAAIAAPAAGEA
jgi:hypothetical protein